MNLNFRSCLARFDIELDLSYSKMACSKVSFLQDQSYNQGYTMSYGGGYDNMQQGYDYSAGYQSAAAPASSKLNLTTYYTFLVIDCRHSAIDRVFTVLQFLNP